ncbi:Aste57867_19787 [Aphanomyces stellatus]|uniref:Aste57867_19787 protein n=1 Tax=Aphanomyces stellatus TaxID=120398 RepID=A0A485LF94_9STRA|nr:hypothetical protein As57867_019722 [Aphanomyces stellatus]VFT96485.1 Aste57867_19787 [Aphanomyces stellatus]
MGNAATACFDHAHSAAMSTPPTPEAYTMSLEQLETLCVDGDLILCREFVYNPYMMTSLNPVVVNGIATAAVSGNFSTKRRDLPAWTSCGLLVRHGTSLHVLEASKEMILLVPLKDKIQTLTTSRLNKFAVRRLQHTHADILPALHRLVGILAATAPLRWDQPCLHPELLPIFARLFALVKRNVASLTLAELDMVRYAFNKHDAECLGWLYLADLPKVAAEIDDMEIFKVEPTWLDIVRAALHPDTEAKFTAEDLVAAAQTVPRRHISLEYNVPLYSSTALTASLLEHVGLLDPVAVQEAIPLVPSVFATPSALSTDKGTFGQEIFVAKPKSTHPDDEGDLSLTQIMLQTWHAWQAT